MSTITDLPSTVNVDGKDEDAHIIGSGLLPHHIRELRASGLSDKTILEARIFSEVDRVKLARYLERKTYPRNCGPGLIFPFIDTDGNVAMRRVKPDRPQKRNGKPVKYIQPSGVPTRPYFPPGVRSAIDEPKHELLVTEGEKKALKGTQEGYATIGLTGVDCWHGKKSTALHIELSEIRWHNRPAYIVFDSDAADNVNVRNNECLLAAALQTHGAIVKVVRLPTGPNGEKVGLDDYLVARGHDLRKLLDAAEEPEPPDAGSIKEPASDIIFENEAESILSLEKKDGLSRLWYWNDNFWRWRNGFYRELPDGEVRAKITEHLNRSFFKVTKTAITNVVEQLRAQSFLSGRTAAPAWLRSASDECKKWDTKGLLVTKNAII